VSSNPNKEIHQPAHTILNERYDSERVYNISSVHSIHEANESSIQSVISDIKLMRLKGSNGEYKLKTKKLAKMFHINVYI
jgi:hypothetical protein